MPDPRGEAPFPEKVRVLHRDPDFLIVYKPPGIHVHPSDLAPGEPSLLKRLARQEGRPFWPVHRLDRATQGLLVWASSPEVSGILSSAWDRAQKKYRCLVRGWIPEVLDLQRPLTDPQAPEGPEKPCRTVVTPLQHYQIPWPEGPFGSLRLTWCQAELFTGRRHQIRRHLAQIRHPVLGDSTYGDLKKNRELAANLNLAGLQLYAWDLTFPHPRTQEIINFTLPQDLQPKFESLQAGGSPSLEA